MISEQVVMVHKDTIRFNADPHQYADWEKKQSTEHAISSLEHTSLTHQESRALCSHNICGLHIGLEHHHLKTPDLYSPCYE